MTLHPPTDGTQPRPQSYEPARQLNWDTDSSSAHPRRESVPPIRREPVYGKDEEETPPKTILQRHPLQAVYDPQNPRENEDFPGWQQRYLQEQDQRRQSHRENHVPRYPQDPPPPAVSLSSDPNGPASNVPTDPPKVTFDYQRGQPPPRGDNYRPDMPRPSHGPTQRRSVPNHHMPAIEPPLPRSNEKIPGTRIGGIRLTKLPWKKISDSSELKPGANLHRPIPLQPTRNLHTRAGSSLNGMSPQCKIPEAWPIIPLPWATSILIGPPAH